MDKEVSCWDLLQVFCANMSLSPFNCRVPSLACASGIAGPKVIPSLLAHSSRFSKLYVISISRLVTRRVVGITFDDPPSQALASVL